MKKLACLWVICLSLNTISLAQVDTTYIYKTGLPYGTLDLRLAKSATRYYYLRENQTFSFRENSSGAKTNSYRDMTSWDSSPYTQGNLREKSGAADYFVMNYRLLQPQNYNASYSSGYPLVVMMHGLGERGNCWDAKCWHADRNWNPTANSPAAPTAENEELLNNDHNLLHGGRQHLDARNLAGTRLPNDPGMPARAFPGFVLFPQNLNGWTGATVQDAIRLIRLIAKKYNIDEDRIYIHGLSQGGYAVYETIKRAPWLFAASMQMSSVNDAGVISQNQLSKISHIPMWLFQGGIDTNPTPAKTEGYIKTFREAGMVIRYSRYDHLGHGTWNTAYKEPDFFSWMLKNNKSGIHVFADNPSICLTNNQGVRMELAQGFHAYQWERNGAIISGATGATYTATSPGVYRARFSRVKNPTSAQWNQWSASITVTEKNPPQAQMEQIGTVLLKDLNNFGDARLKATGEFAHYYWYKNGTLVNLTGNQDDTTRHAILKQGNCTGTCTGNGTYTLVTADYDNCPSPPSKPKYVYFNNQAPVNITAPGNFKGQVLSASSVKLTWADASGNEAGFEIWHRKVTGSTSPWQMRTLTGVNATSFTDTGLEPSAQYHYKIRVVGNSGRSNYTPSAANQYLVISTTDDNTNPSVPQNLTATATAINTITLKWNPSTDNTGIRQYRITYGSQTVATGSSATTHVLSGLNLNTNYTFTVRAEDLGGNLSGASSSATANTFVTGLYYEHSTGAWTDLDAINWNIAEFSGKVPNFTLGPRTQEDYFNFKFDGYLYIKAGGAYQFSTISSDGSRVEVNGAVVVENDGVHGNKTVNGPTQTLSAGAKRIIVKFFEYDGAQALTVRYKGPDTGGSWTNIPESALRSSATSSSMLMARADSDTTAIEEPVETMDVSVYPNPTSPSDINIQVESESESTGDAPLLVQVMDFTGRSVYQGTFMLDELRGGIRVTSDATIPDGLYVVIVQQNNKVQKKIIAIKN